MPEQQQSEVEEYDFSFLDKSETRMQRMKRKVKENPLVPIGLCLTVAALGLGIANFHKGDQRKQQLMMRARVLAQGGTVLAMLGGLYIATKDKKK